MFQGTNEANNDVAGAVSIAAVMSAAKYNRKTLLIQMTNMHFQNAENMLIGKKKEESQIKLETFRLEDKGIDALVRRADTTKKLTKEHFDMACEPLLKYENMLDSATVTKKEDFEINLTVKDARVILKYATDVYDNVFILLNGQNTAVMQELLELSDVYVTCFSQSPNKEIFNSVSGKRALKVVTDYDTTSAYNTMSIKKLYGDKKIYLIPHNSGYRDAYLDGTLLQYILKNMNNTSEDSNYMFMKHVTDLMDGIMGKENWSEEIPEPLPLESDASESASESEENVLEEIEEDGFDVSEVEEIKGLFGKKSTKKVISVPTYRSSSPSLDEEYEEEYEEQEEFIESEIETNEDEEYECECEYDDDSDSDSEAEEEEEETGDEEIEDEEIKPVSKPKRIMGIKANKKATPEGKKEKENRIEDADRGRNTLVTSKMKTIPLKTAGSKKNANSNVNVSPSKNAPKAMKKADVTASTNWVCSSCGEENTGKFCMNCGNEKPAPTPEPVLEEIWVCPECGEENMKKFCMNCGNPRPVNKKWFCPECGTENIKNFCAECGYKR